MRPDGAPEMDPELRCVFAEIAVSKNGAQAAGKTWNQPAARVGDGSNSRTEVRARKRAVSEGRRRKACSSIASAPRLAQVRHRTRMFGGTRVEAHRHTASAGF